MTDRNEDTAQVSKERWREAEERLWTECRQVDLEQGSPEWHAWRRSKFTASEAAVVMGCAPSWWEISTPDQLRAYKETGEKAGVSEYVEKMRAAGHAMETIQREEGVEPLCFERGPYGASLDGYDLVFNQWFEIKAPRDRNSKIYRAVRSKVRSQVANIERMPEYVWWQLVHQAFVVPEDCHTCVYIVAPNDGAPYVSVDLSRAELLEAWPKLEAAWQAFAEGRPNLPADGDEALALEYMEALREHDHAKSRLDRAKAGLLAAGPRTIPDLVAIETSPVKGRIDWKRAALDAGFDAEEADYRGEPTTRTTIKLLAG